MKNLNLICILSFLYLIIILIFSTFFGSLSSNLLFYNEKIFIKNYENSFLEKDKWKISSESNLNFLQIYFDELYLKSVDFIKSNFLEKYNLEIDNEIKNISVNTNLYNYLENLLSIPLNAIMNSNRDLNTNFNPVKKIYFKNYFGNHIDYLKNDSLLLSSFFKAETMKNYYDYKSFVMTSFLDLLIQLLNKQLANEINFLAINVTPSTIVTIEKRVSEISSYKFEYFDANSYMKNSLWLFICINIILPISFGLIFIIYFLFLIYYKYKKMPRRHWIITRYNNLAYKKITKLQKLKFFGWLKEK